MRLPKHLPEVARAHPHGTEEALRLLEEVRVDGAEEREAREEDVPPPLDRLERVEEGVRVRARARLGLGLG